MTKLTKSSPHLYRWISLVCFSFSVILVMVALVFYSRERSNYPIGQTIGGVPVGGLNSQEATQRLLQTFSLPIEATVLDTSFQIDPSLVGFTLNTEAMIADADLKRTGNSFWRGFWNYLWNIKTESEDVPLVYSINSDRLKTYITEELKTRYDQPATPAMPVPGQTTFQAGEPGSVIPVESTSQLIEQALKSASNRSINIVMAKTNAGRPTFENLQIQITQIIDTTPFNGVVGVYLEDLSNGQVMHFGYDNNAVISADPDIAFTASSTIKIPILYSVFNHLGPKLNETTKNLVMEMITKSENPASDALMEQVGGPLVVSDDMKNIGLDSTFLAGYFYDGAPLLQVFNTPANSRFDVVTNPDGYNQTTPSEMGELLSDLYKCSTNGEGTLVGIAPEKFNKETCTDFLNYLKQDRIGVLLESGLPEGTPIAHKHGWISGPSGVIQNISDAGIVYTPSGDYVIVVYVYHPEQTVWEPVSGMIAKISEVVYNYFNLPK